MPDRFLVTGTLGFIGAWSVRALVDEGTPVVAFDMSSDRQRLELIMSPDQLAHVTRAAARGERSVSPLVGGRTFTMFPTSRASSSRRPGRCK